MRCPNRQDQYVNQRYPHAHKHLVTVKTTVLPELAQNLTHINTLWQLIDSRQLSLFTGSDANYTIMASQMLSCTYKCSFRVFCCKIIFLRLDTSSFYATSIFGAYLWTSQVQEWQRQPRQSRWHSASGLCWSCGASGARFWWGQTCVLRDTSRPKSRRIDNYWSNIITKIPTILLKYLLRLNVHQPSAPVYDSRHSVTGHRVRRKLHHHCKSCSSLPWHMQHYKKGKKCKA